MVRGPSDAGALERSGTAQGDQVADVGGRTVLNFNTDWKFIRGDVAIGQSATVDDGVWGWVNLPHNIKFNTPEDVTEYLGVAWYRKEFSVSPGMEGTRAFIEFGAAMQRADVWLNGSHLTTHVGGYTPFTIDVTGHLNCHEENQIAVRVDTRPNPAWAPGRTGVDFRYFGGLYRDVTMVLTNPIHITDAVYKGDVAGGGLFITTPIVARSSSVVQVRTDILNESADSCAITVHTDVLDDSNTVVATASTAARDSVAAGHSAVIEQRLMVHNATLWHPDCPHLYKARVTVFADGMQTDERTETLGIRSIDWRHEGLYINGARFKAIGANKHQEIYGLGNAVSDHAIFLDVKRVKDAGFDFIRTSHYPNAPAFYAACDELGVLVLNSMTGWQTFNNSDAFTNNTHQELREMIRRDRNHPSVVAWETSLNETNYSAEWAKEAHRIAHEEYPGDQMFTAGWMDYFDIFMGASQHGIRDTGRPKPILISEWGDWDYGGNSSTSRVRRESYDSVSQEHNNLSQASNHQEGLNANLGAGWFSADALWDFADMSGYNPGASLMGVLDYYRIPKYSSYLFKSQRDADILIPGVDSGPMVFIANTWSADSPTQVRVFSNAEQVRLYRNGTLLATQFPDIGPNTANLPHPPFTFAAGAYSPGMLRAEALIGGNIVATQVRRTAGAPAKIVLTREALAGLYADGSDARLVFIHVQDAAGTTAYTSAVQTTLSVTGPGQIVGPTTLSMKGGQLAVWIRAGRTAGEITLKASAAGLESGITGITAVDVPGLPAPQYGGADIAPDIALGVVATASSYLPGWPPAYAVDRDPARGWMPGFRRAISGEGHDAGESWIQLDLQKSHDLCGSALTWDKPASWPYVILVSSDGIVWDVAADRSDANTQLDAPARQVSDSWLATGRFVRALFPGVGPDERLSVNEFCLQGTASSPPSPLDIAQEKMAVLASGFAPGHEPDVANNGNPVEYWQAGCAGPAWWLVDLGARFRLSSTLVTWLDGGTRAYQYTIAVSTDAINYATVVEQSANTTASNDSQDLFDAVARYVRLSVRGGPTEESPVGVHNFKTLGVPVPDVVARKACQASSSRPDHDAAGANDLVGSTSWQSDPSANADHWWRVDLGAGFELSGLDLELVPGSRTGYWVETSLDGKNWTAVGASGRTAHLMFPGPALVRYVRINFPPRRSEGFAGISEVMGYPADPG